MIFFSHFLSLFCLRLLNCNEKPQTAAENGDMRSHEQLESSLEERIEELRHRLRIEAAVVDGAKNVIRTLQSNKTIDKKALQEVSEGERQMCINNFVDPQVSMAIFREFHR